jgi:hypothetical protein
MTQFLAIFSVLFLCFKAEADFLSVLSQLKSIEAKDHKIIEKARECLPQLKNGRYLLCTGGEIPDINKFTALDLNSCLSEIQSHGYKTTYDNIESSISTKEYESFLNSTKRAETFHEVKTVAFRKSVANRIDCLHELVHVYQWTSGSKEDLVPPNRSKHTKLLQKKLEAAVEEIAKSEKAKRFQEARSRAEQLKPYLDHFKKWNALTDWLDEKDAHFVIFSQCPKLKCSLTDLDVATANLVKRKPYLPVSFYPTLDQRAEEVLHELKKDKP